MKASKGRFALATVSTLFSCLVAAFAASSVELPSLIISKVSEVAGFGSLDIGAISPYIVIPLTIITVIAISRFASTAIQNWDAPVRVSEAELAERHLQNDIYALTFEQLKLIAKRQPDPIASDYISNWEKSLVEPPKHVETKHLLRDLFVMSKQEVQILDGDWRSEGQLWAGKIFGVRKNDVKEVVAFIFDRPPSESDLQKRIQQIQTRSETDGNPRYFALYLSGEGVGEFSGMRLIGSDEVEILSSRRMIFQGLDLNGYARKLLNVFNSTKVGGTKATLGNSFVDLKIKSADTSETVSSLSSKLEAWSNTETNAHLAITGEYGQGKSTALLSFCCEWAERFLDDGEITERVPLLIELRGKSPSEVDPLGFLSTWCSRYQLLPEQVLNLIKSGDAIVIFEGFDELKNSGRAFDRHQHFNALWRFAYPGTKLIFTGRPNFFLDQIESNRTLRYDNMRGADGSAYTELWQILKLDGCQIESACRDYEDHVRLGLISSIGTNEDFFDIVSRPSMLPVVATIWDDIEKLQSEGIKLTGAVLLELYIQAVFSRKEAELEQDRVRYDAPQGSRYLSLPKHVRELLTICVAWRMSGIGARNTIPRFEITEMVREVYDTLFAVAKADKASPAIVSGMFEFEKRHSESSKADRIEDITSEICSAGLLIPDPAGGSTNLRFPHKQFFEFLLAKAICIVRSDNMSACSSVILKSASHKDSFIRLVNEPNSIDYLVECHGPSLSVLFDWLDLKVQQFVFGIAVLTRILSNFISAFNTVRMPVIKLAVVSKLTSSLEEKIDSASDTLGLKIISDPNIYRILTVIVSVSAFLLMILELIKHIGGDDPFGALSLVSLGLKLLLMLMAVVLFSRLNPSKVTVLHNYYQAHLERENQKVPSRMSGKHDILIYKSIANNRIEFPDNSVEFNTDFTQFLYPAKEFER